MTNTPNPCPDEDPSESIVIKTRSPHVVFGRTVCVKPGLQGAVWNRAMTAFSHLRVFRTWEDQRLVAEHDLSDIEVLSFALSADCSLNLIVTHAPAVAIVSCSIPLRRERSTGVLSLPPEREDLRVHSVASIPERIVYRFDEETPALWFELVMKPTCGVNDEDRRAQ